MENDLTQEESGWLAVMRLNRLTPRTEIRKKWSLGRASVSFHWRSRKNLMGRFGGGWDWELGIQAGSWRSFIVNLLVFNLWFRWEAAKKPTLEAEGR